MNLRQVIDTYLRGWELGDGAPSLSVTAGNYCYNDPDTGRIERHEFVQFVDDLKGAVEGMGAIANAYPFLLHSDIVIEAETMPAIVRCWRQAAGTELQGSSLIKVGTTGVLHEKFAYFSRLPQPQ